MGRFIFVITLFISTYAFANSHPLNLSQSLSTAWKAQQPMHAQQNKNDIAMVYGGKDVSLKPSVVSSTTVV